MELTVAKFLATHNRTCAGVNHQGSLLDVPVRQPTPIALPMGLVLAVEQNDGVGGRLAGRLLGAARSRSDHLGQWPVTVVNVPAPSGSIGVSL